MTKIDYRNLTKRWLDNAVSDLSCADEDLNWWKDELVKEDINEKKISQLKEIKELVDDVDSWTYQLKRSMDGILLDVIDYDDLKDEDWWR